MGYSVIINFVSNPCKISDFKFIKGGAMFRLAANDRDEDILMIQYETETNNAIPRMIRWNENGFAIPIMDQSNASEHTGMKDWFHNI